jgi:hypothetical protein
VTAHGDCETYRTCSAGVEVMLCTLSAGHVGVYQAIDIPDVTWEIFERQTLP